LSQRITKKTKKLAQAKYIALSAGMPSGLNYVDEHSVRRHNDTYMATYK